MAIFDIFKKKPIRQAQGKKAEKVEKPVLPPKPKKLSETAFRILKGPQVTEKATDLVEGNQYIFRVFPGASKPEIKKAIEDVYGVKVTAVRIINIPRKARRLGRISGWRKSFKKAIIKIAAGQKIEILPR